ncbi:hypothetical protein GCM10009639_52620 [Kitasatospora putterlickiae]|uniref:Uncharacterized protein n=1 Tax=Kitasatospora putterlickiae TaxID=221725 RepID=A0ABN1YI94_9ACTN
MRADEQQAAPAVAEPGVGVEQVRGPVQGDHRLAGAGTAVDDECAARAGPHDGVLVRLDGGQHVPHPCRAAAAEGGDERGLVVEGGVSLQALGGEHLVPVVGDPPVRPAVAAAAGQAHRVGVRRGEERLGGGRAPVEQQPAALAVGQAEPADVHRRAAAVRAAVGRDDAAQAQVQAETAQRAQAAGQAVDLKVPVHRGPSGTAGRPPRDVETVGDLGDRPLQALRDGGEVPLVLGDQRRVGLGGEAVGEVERAGGEGGHGSGSGPGSRQGGRHS